MTPSPDVLASLGPEDVRDDPFPHVTLANCLPAQLYSVLSKALPTPRFGPDTPSNMLSLASPFEPPLAGRLNPQWQTFLDHHVSDAFFASVLRVMGPSISKIYPDLAQKIGSSLEDATVSWRGAGQETDVQLDAQFAFNSPVRAMSSVRGPHVDKPRRLVSGLLYMPQSDDAAGGELMLYRLKGKPKLRGVMVDPDDVAEVSRIPYEANRLILFLNGPTSVHGVLPRQVTDSVRRYVNLFVDVRTPLFQTAADAGAA
ncbi:MAG: 2OG-Fe(II) oxygenase [Alphaproteobacteria bacterium]|nr:2OG-Fe(II) oxygenase [Alphaproteobacteria bacterium]